MSDWKDGDEESRAKQDEQLEAALKELRDAFSALGKGMPKFPDFPKMPDFSKLDVSPDAQRRAWIRQTAAQWTAAILGVPGSDVTIATVEALVDLARIVYRKSESA